MCLNPKFLLIKIREKHQLDDPLLDALIIPGGESTTMALIAERNGMLEKLREWVKKGKPVWVSWHICFLSPSSAQSF